MIKDNWHSMDTAPKDGTRILVAIVDIQWVAWWSDNEGAYSYAPGYYLDYPDAWMPLPRLYKRGK